MCLHCTCLIRNRSSVVANSARYCNGGHSDDSRCSWSGAPVSCRCGAAGRCIRQMCQRAFGLQTNSRSTDQRKRRCDSNPTHQAAVCLCRRSTGRKLVMSRSDRHSHDGEYFRAFDGETGSGGHPTADGKIKAARCGAVGGRKSAERSGTSHNVRQDMTVCRFAQVPGKSTLRAHCVHPHHDPRR